MFFLWYKCFWSVITQFCFKKFNLCNHPLNIMLIPNKRHPVSNWAPQTTTNWRKLVASKRLTSDSLRISPITFWGKRRAIGFYALENVMLDLVGKDLKQVKLFRNGYVSISCCHLFCFVRKYHVNIIFYAKIKSHTSLFQKWRYHTKRPCSPNLHFFDSFISISSFTSHGKPHHKKDPTQRIHKCLFISIFKIPRDTLRFFWSYLLNSISTHGGRNDFLFLSILSRCRHRAAWPHGPHRCVFWWGFFVSEQTKHPKRKTYSKRYEQVFSVVMPIVARLPDVSQGSEIETCMLC